MKAIICENYCDPDELVFAHLPTPKPDDNQVLVKVLAAGVNFPDTLIIQGKYQLKPSFPFAPGFEVVGEVIECGAHVRSIKTGDKIVGLAANGYGAFAEMAVVNASEAISVPNEVNHLDAVAIYTAAGTSFHALHNRANLSPHEFLLVNGAAGGVGLTAVQIGKSLGATVIAAASSKQKLKIASENGADFLIDYQTQDIKQEINRITNGYGLDVCLDPVGGEIFNTVSRCMAWGGRLLTVGFASGQIPTLPANLALLKGYSLVGVYWGESIKRNSNQHKTNFVEIFELLRIKKIKPNIHKIYALAEVPIALAEISNRQINGKLVIDLSK